MRVCLVLPYSWSFPNGVQKHVDFLACRLEQRGHEVAVVSPYDPPDRTTRFLHGRPGCYVPPERVRMLGRTIPVPSNGTLVNHAFSPGVFRTVRRTIERLQPDVLHVHEPLVPPVSWAAVRAAKALDIPVVGTFHAHYTDGCIHYRLFKPVLRPIFQKLDARTAVSRMARKTVAEHLPGEFRIVPNGVDTERFEPGTRNGHREPFEVLFVGRPAARKGLPVLLDTFDRLLGKVPEARLVIVGSRPEDVRLPKRLISSVEVRGMVSEEDLIRAMHSASLLCAPSVRAESFGMILIEAMAAGLPVVASDIPGYDAVITPGKDGILVPPGDPSALTNALAVLLRNPSRRKVLSRAGLATARRYDWSHIAAGTEEVYASVRGHALRAKRDLVPEL